MKKLNIYNIFPTNYSHFKEIYKALFDSYIHSSFTQQIKTDSSIMNCNVQQYVFILFVRRL